MKKLLILGGDHFTIPVVEAAHKQGYYVITCDYLPNNVAHKYSDAFINYSTIDKEGILAWARKNPIDGILTFTDSGVITTAYVQHYLGLPQIGPLESVEILQNKARFRRFLADNGFNVPRAKGYASFEDAINDAGSFKWPIMVKPVDSAGSKGVSKIEKLEQLKEAVDFALNFSVSKEFIIEEFIEKDGCSSDSDCFSVDGCFKFISFSAQRFDENSMGIYTPAAYSWPATMTSQAQKELSEELQRLISLLGMKTTIYNIETRVGADGNPYIMEVTPRGGGNRLAEMLRYATGVDMITAAVRASVGDSIYGIDQKPFDGFWAEIIVHSKDTGELDEIEIDDTMAPFIVEKDFWYRKGDMVKAFTSARDAIGTLILKFEKQSKMEESLCDISSWLKVLVRK